jgi:dTDP-4-dehydrorhamnose reductase
MVPTSAQDLAQTIMALALHLKKNTTVNWGTYHFCGKGVTTWHQFAVRIFDFAQLHHLFARPRIKPVATNQYPTAAKRPTNSALDCELIQKNFGIRPNPWQKSLETTINRIIRHDRKKKS